jgi:hypothetical protein
VVGGDRYRRGPGAESERQASNRSHQFST